MAIAGSLPGCQPLNRKSELTSVLLFPATVLLGVIWLRTADRETTNVHRENRHVMNEGETITDMT